MKHSLNVTPLIDVLLVLLVIFMVSASTDPVGLEARIPQPPLLDERAKPETALVLAISRDGELRLNQERLEMSSIVPRLEETLRQRHDRSVFVQADPDLLFDEVAHVIDLARGAGADRIGLLTHAVE